MHETAGILASFAMIKNIVTKIHLWLGLITGIVVLIVSIITGCINKLNNENLLLIVVSTHGKGEPPPSAKPFFSIIDTGYSFSLPGDQHQPVIFLLSYILLIIK